MRVTQDVTIIEVKHVEKVIHTGDVAIHNPGLNHVLPLPSQDLPVEHSFQPRRPDLDGTFERLPIDRVGFYRTIWFRRARDEPLRVVGLVQGECGPKNPSMRLQRHRDFRAEIKAPQHSARLKAWFAAREPGDGSIKRPEQW